MTTDRYNAFAVALHWAMAVAIIGMLIGGFVMTSEILDKSLRFTMIQWHKALGVLMLLAIAARLVLRLATHPPALPNYMMGWERTAAGLGHIALYALMLIMPITGWLMVSSSQYGLPTLVFGWFTWPHLPGVAADDAVNGAAKALHYYAAFAFIAVIASHLAGTVKHIWMDGHALLYRMWFDTPKRALLGLGGVAASVLALAVLPLGGAASVSTPSLNAPAVSVADAAPGAYVVDYGASTVSFSGIHAGDQFRGTFSEWSADIQFDPGALADSRADIRFALSSASTGNPFYDGTLPESDWFDIANHPEGRFAATSVVAGDQDGTFIMEGDLTLRGKSLPLRLPFTYDVVEDGTAIVKGSVIADRLAYGIGENSDATAEWVSQEITIDIDIRAARQSDDESDLSS